MSAPRDALQILREYSCGCITYRRYDATHCTWVESDEKGLFCPSRVGDVLTDTPNGHKRALVQGRETQPDLFHVPVGTRRLA